MPAKIDLTGKKFGKLTVLKESENKINGRVSWICKCSCGNDEQIIVSSNSLRTGNTKSCGCIYVGGRKLNISGDRFGKLIAINESHMKNGRTFWNCKCDCGNMTVVAVSKLTSGHTKSCGCLLGRHHGLSKNPLYLIWHGMHRRCSKDTSRNYLKKGIKVCPEWKIPETFVKWAITNGYKKGLQLDRIDNDGDYHPSNCRFVTGRRNGLNKTDLMANNTSGFIGVRKVKEKFSSHVGYNGKTFHVGTFDTSVEAALARDLYIMTNFPKDGYPLNFDFREEQYNIRG